MISSGSRDHLLSWHKVRSLTAPSFLRSAKMADHAQGAAPTPCPGESGRGLPLARRQPPTAPIGFPPLTDITSFSAGRATTYTLLLLFYSTVVIVEVCLCRRFQRFLERRHATS